MFVERSMKTTCHPCDRHLDSSERAVGQFLPHRHCQAWLQAILFLISLLASNALWATGCSSLNGNPKTFTINLGGGSVMIPRDTATGAVLYTVNGPQLPQGSVADTSSWIAQCTNGNGITNGVLMTTPWPAVSPGLYATNVSGIAVRIKRFANTFPFSYAYTPASFTGGGPPYGWYFNAGPIVTYSFEKTGPISGGTVTAADIANVGMNYDGTVYAFYTNTSGQLTFTVGACVTPDIQVPLDPMPTSAFSGAGSTAGAKPFSIAVNGCPPGLNSVMYQLDAASGISVINAAQGVIGLGQSASATGVGLQIRDGSNNPVSFGAMHATTGYNKTSGGSFSIPLKAMYYQTAARMTAGSVASQAVFTMSYQ